jgi:ASCH domain-containing protein
VQNDAPIDPDRIALGIQQPWAELILRGIKTLEVRSQPTRQRGTIYLYASKRPSPLPAALAVAARHRIDVESLPFGVLVGTVNLIGCRACRSGDHKAACVPPQLVAGQFAWELAEPTPLAVPLAVRFLPYGVWFYPFKRRPGGPRRRRTS